MKSFPLVVGIVAASLAMTASSFAAGYPDAYAQRILANKVPLAKAVEIALKAAPGRIGSIGYIIEKGQNVFHAFIVDEHGVTQWVKINADDGTVLMNKPVPAGTKFDFSVVGADDNS